MAEYKLFYILYESSANLRYSNLEYNHLEPFHIQGDNWYGSMLKYSQYNQYRIDFDIYQQYLHL